MNYHNKADDTRIKARMQKKHFHYCVPFAVAVILLFMIGCATNPPLPDTTDVSGDQTGKPIQEAVGTQHTGDEGNNIKTPGEGTPQTLSSTETEPVSTPTFPTFKNTGQGICTNSDGLPLIYLFSSSRCPHCRWGGSIYDFIVRFYTAKGLIEAHHYDLLSGDDLLTEEVETKIPEDKLELYNSGDPKDLVPYYNFGCKYDRVGNGYEKEDDLTSEGEEMRRVIDFLVKSVSKGK